MLSRFFSAERIGFKKTPRASEQNRPDVAERGDAWRRARKSSGGQLIFVDEAPAFAAAVRATALSLKLMRPSWPAATLR